jgi:hypothetical protein
MRALVRTTELKTFSLSDNVRQQTACQPPKPASKVPHALCELMFGK